MQCGIGCQETPLGDVGSVAKAWKTGATPGCSESKV